MIQLDPNNPSPAYRCGRLLAVLEQAQRLAVPSAEATVVSRFLWHCFLRSSLGVRAAAARGASASRQAGA